MIKFKYFVGSPSWGISIENSVNEWLKNLSGSLTSGPQLIGKAFEMAIKFSPKSIPMGSSGAAAIINFTTHCSSALLRIAVSIIVG